jgi:hypothetical protein
LLAANEVGLHTAVMGVRPVVVALGSALLLGACGHDSPGSSSEPDAGPPGGSQTTVRYPQPRCIHGSTPGLCATVRAYLVSRVNGEFRRAYDVLSARCRADRSFAQFKHQEGLAAPRGVRIEAHVSHDTAHGSVIYMLPWTPFTNLAQAWVKEHGKWKNDGCQPQ